MSTEPKLRIKLEITERSKLIAAVITGLLAVFVAKEMGAFLQPDVENGSIQLALSILCVLGVAAIELVSFRWVGRWAKRVEQWMMVILFLLMPIGTLGMMEFLHGTFIYDWAPLTFFHNYVFILLLNLLGFAIFGRMRFALILTNSVAMLFGLINHYVLAFRGTPFLPIDIASAKTGFTVAGSFDFSPDNHVVLAVALFVFLIVLSCRIRVDQEINRKAVWAVRIAGLALTLGFSALLFETDWFAEHGMKPDFFNQTRGYTNRGSMLQFVINAKYLEVKEPKDYDAENMDDIMGDALQPDGTEVNDKRLPNVICIMNETFSDLSVVGDVPVNEDYMPFIRSMEENTIKGYVHVPVYGAGTANSEFEFLTGNSLSFLPMGACAYESYIKGFQPSLATTLDMLGYYSVAFHPYYGDNWSRETVYPWLGFHDYIDISDLLGADIVEEYRSDKNFNKYSQAVENKFYGEHVFMRRYVSDQFDYKKIYEEQAKVDAAGDQPFFMFNVTMQNHSAYRGTYSNFDPKIHLTGEMEGKYPKADQYLSLIKEADTAVQGLIEHYSRSDEPTIICFFGDHQASIERELYEELFGKSLDELTLEEEHKMYMTPFFIWANFDIPEQEIDAISVNYLSALLMETAGLPMTSYQKYLMELHETLPIVTTVGYMDNTGAWYRTDDSSAPYANLIEDYRKVQYNNLLDPRHRVEELFVLDMDEIAR